MITARGVEIAASDPLAIVARRELTVAPTDASEKYGVRRYTRSFPVWTRIDDVIVVPRFWALQKFSGNLRAAWSSNPMTIPEDRSVFQGKLREKQPDAVHAVLGSLHACGGAILSAAVGEGKTCMACHIISHMRLKTVVLVHKVVLLEQWISRIRQFIPNARVTTVRGAHLDTSGDIIVAMLQTVVARPHLDFPGAGMLIVDEAHHISAESFSSALRCRCFQYTLGLSATPDRKDGLVCVMHWLVGPLAYESKRTDMHDVAVQLVTYTCDRYAIPPPTTKFGTLDHVAVISAMATDEARTRVIEHVVRSLAAEHKIVLVLSHRRDHCLRLASMLEDLGAAAMLGGQKNTPETPIVCATYAVASEGFDDPRLNALVLATPCADIRQAVGRILRAPGPKRVVDLVDQYGPSYAHAAKRKAYYRAAGFTFEQPYLFV